MFSSPAFAIDVYYSVGTDASDLKADATVTMTGGDTATFSAPQPENIGAGDRITYNSSSSVAYITSRVSDTQFAVSDAQGGNVANGGPWAVNSITRAFGILNNAVNTAAVPNASNDAHLDTSDLTSGPYTLYVVCYGGTTADAAPVTIDGWITDAVNTIHIIPSRERRYKGRWDTGAYRLAVNSGDAVTVLDDNIHISGLQVSLSGSADDGIVCAGGNDELFVSGTIIRYAGANPPGSSAIVLGDAGQAGVSAYLWNNIVYDFLGTDNAGIRAGLSGAGSKIYVYNNTVYNNTVGIDNVAGTNTIVAKNNIAYWNGDNYGGLGTFDASSSHNLSGPNTDAQIPGTGAKDGEAVGFVDVADRDFRLAAKDAAAQDGGTDLSADANLSFVSDVEGQRRGRRWDIGADERVFRALSVKSGTDPVMVQLGNGTVAEDLQITFTGAAGGLDILKKGGYGTTWGTDLIPAGTLFSIGGESGAAAHSVVQDSASEVIVKKTRAGIVSFYHIYPSGRVVLDASGASSVTVNETAVFPEYANGTAHTGGYHAYVDLLRTASGASADYLLPDIPSVIAGARVTDRALDYGQDGFEEGEGDYPVTAASDNAVVDFDGAPQTRYDPVLRLEEFFPRTASGATLLVYWDAQDTSLSGGETWTGLLTSALTASTGLRGAAQKNDSADDYASLQTSSNINDPGTLSLWVKSSSFTNPSASEYLFYAGEDFNLYFDASGQLHFRIAAGVDLTFAADVYDNAWHEVTCTWDYLADTYGLYVDGKLGAKSTNSYAAPGWDATMYLTAEDAAGTSRFAGSIDEVRLYNAVILPTGHALWYSRLDSSADITSPQAGSGGAVAGAVSFPGGVRGNAVLFNGAGEYASLPGPGNINAPAGTLELWVKTAAAGNPLSDEQIFYAGTDFQLYFDAQGHVNFKINAAETLANAQDVYDGAWHHVKALWDYGNDQYFLYVDGKQVDKSAGAYNAPALDTDLYIGAADDADTNRYNGAIDGLAIYDTMIFPYGAFYVPDAWGDALGKTDASVLLYWDADSDVLNLGAGDVTLGGSMATGAGVNGLAIVNGAAGDYAAFASAGNMAAEEGSLAFWVKSAGAGSPSGAQYLLYAGDTFNVFFDASGFLNFMADGAITLQGAADIYDSAWHFVRVSWDYNNDLYELFIDGIRCDRSTDAAAAPVLGPTVYLSASDASGTNRFDGSLDEVYITNAQATAEIASAYGMPVLPPQAASAYAFRLEAGASLTGLSADDLFTPSSDFVASATNSPSAYVLQYLGDISTGASPSLSGVTALQNANTGNVTISYTGTDPDNDTVLYVPQECLYSLDSTDGTDGTWSAMTSSETGENFTSAGAALSYVWDARNTNDYNSMVYLKLKVRDEMGHESLPAAIPSVAVDALAPAGLGNFRVTGSGTTMIVLSWDAVTDDNWLNDAHYEIWYGQDQEEVRDRDGTAALWDNTNDPYLTQRTTVTTTVSGLTADTDYYFKIWAVDGFANEATVNDVSATTSKISSSRVYRVQIDSIYDAESDALLITASLLTRSGSVVSDLTNLTLTYVGVLDNAGNLLSGNLNGGTDTVASSTDAVFYTTWDPASGLSANTTYTVVARISYQGEAYSGVKAVNVRELDVLTGETNDVVAKTVTLTNTVSTLDSKIDAVTEKIDQHEGTQTTFRDTRQEQAAAVAADVGAVAEDTTVELVEVLEDTVETGTAKGIQSEIVTRGTTVVSGTTITIMFRGATGASPTLTVYDPRNVIRVSNSVMKEAGATGMYSYDLTFNVSWGLGDFTVLVRDPVNQSMDSVLLNVVQSSSFSSSSSAGAGSTSVTTDLVYSRLNDMNGDINNLLEGVTDVNTVAADVSGSIDGLLDDLGLAQNSGTMDAQAIGSIAQAAQALLGAEGDSATVSSKLADLEGMLNGIGSDAMIAANLTKDSRSKAKAVRLIASKIQDLLAEGDIEAAQAELENLAENLGGLKEDVDGVPGAVTADSLSEEVQGAVDELARIAAEKGLQGLIPPIKPPAPGKPANPEDIIEVRNNVNEIKSLMAEVKDYLDQEINKPIVHAWFEGE